MLRFRLKTLPIVVTLLAVPLAWLAWQTRGAYRQRAVIQTIIAHGGGVLYDHNWNSAPFSTGVPHSPPWFGPLLQSIGGKDLFQNAMDVRVEVTDPQELEAIASLPYLTELYLTGKGVNNESVKLFRQCHQLRALSLRDTSITDEGLEAIAMCRGILWLDIGGDRITDAAAEHLKCMTELTSLVLDGKGITDRSLALIGTLPNLEDVQLWNTSASEKGLLSLAALAKATEIQVESARIDDVDAGMIFWKSPSMKYVEISQYALAPPVGHPASNPSLVAGEVVLQIHGIEDARLGGQKLKTNETASFRVSISVANGTSEAVNVSWHGFKHTLQATCEKSPIFALHVAGGDPLLLINETKSVMPRTCTGIHYPVACYQRKIEQGKQYILTIEGLGQTCTFPVEF